MRLVLGTLLGAGGFADVYEAVDELDRQVAVKIIRPSAAGFSSALDHARALARLKHPHPNVVTVYALDKVTDPDSGLEVDCVVMEMVEGETLSKRLQGDLLSSDEARAIGSGVLKGLGYIHENGLVHGDLHGENIMVSGMTAKIIDILYRNSLALLSTASREAQIHRDLLNAQVVLQDLLRGSDLGPAGVSTFNSALGNSLALDDLERAFLAVLDTSPSTDNEAPIQRALDSVTDPGFVDGDKYAQALANETPPRVTLDLLKILVGLHAVGDKHRSYLRCLWDRLPKPQRKDVVTDLAASLYSAVPSGAWGAPVASLLAFGREAWDLLPETSRIRFEAAVLKDIRSGYFDIFAPKARIRGALGTWVNSFWAWFSERDTLVDNIADRLSSDWYGQNYVAKYLWSLLPLIGDSPERRAKLIDALKEAVRNDARLVVSGLGTLPLDWQEELKPKETPRPSGETSEADPFADFPESLDLNEEDDDLPF